MKTLFSFQHSVTFGHLSSRASFMMTSLLCLSLSQPLVLDQDCMTLSSRDLRLEKRTLFRYSKTQQAVKVNPGLEMMRLLQNPTENANSFLSFSRLDLVPINRSVGLKAKPTKPVTEVLRPVVAKYGLHLSELVARIVGLPFIQASFRWTDGQCV